MHASVGKSKLLYTRTIKDKETLLGQASASSIYAITWERPPAPSCTVQTRMLQQRNLVRAKLATLQLFQCPEPADGAVSGASADAASPASIGALPRCM